MIVFKLYVSYHLVKESLNFSISRTNSIEIHYNLCLIYVDSIYAGISSDLTPM
jgi:hypothetical protein